TSSGGYSPSDAVEWVCRSMCAVCAFRSGPGGLRGAEQLQQLALAELGDRGVGTAVPHRREPGEAAPAVFPGALLAQETDLVAPVHRHAAGRRDLPRLAVHGVGALRHGPPSASAAIATPVHRTHA